MLNAEKGKIVEYCKRMIHEGLVKGTGGNISIFDPSSGYFAISPSGMEYEKMTPGDIVIMDLDGNIVEGDRKPSSEYEMHKIFYQNRDDTRAVVHTHSRFATVLATLREGLPAANYLVAYAGPDIRCAEYASFGTKELAENAFKSMEGRKAVILANHGLTCVGKTIEEAYNIADQIESCCEVYILARSAGTPVLLSEDEMYRMIDKFERGYGQTGSQS